MVGQEVRVVRNQEDRGVGARNRNTAVICDKCIYYVFSYMGLSYKLSFAFFRGRFSVIAGSEGVVDMAVGGEARERCRFFSTFASFSARFCIAWVSRTILAAALAATSTSRDRTLSARSAAFASFVNSISSSSASFSRRWFLIMDGDKSVPDIC